MATGFVESEHQDLSQVGFRKEPGLQEWKMKRQALEVSGRDSSGRVTRGVSEGSIVGESEQQCGRK